MISLSLHLIAIATGADNECSVVKQLGCFSDSADHRALEHVAFFGTHPTQAPTFDLPTCAQKCCSDGFQGTDVLVGVEFGVQCFCGNGWASGTAPATSSACGIKCPGNSSQVCGGSDAINVFTASCPLATPTNPCSDPFPPSPPSPGPSPPAPPSGPRYRGCTDPGAASKWPYCDVTKSDGERVDLMLALLDLTDLIALISPTEKPYCMAHTSAVSKAGLPKYVWLAETNSCVMLETGLKSCLSVPAGSASTGCVTVFVGPTGMAASFNQTSWAGKGTVISNELRAANNVGQDTGLSGFGPNINTLKDPRWGRNSELPGEDPFLSGSYAAAYGNAMQVLGSGKNSLEKKMYQKMLSYVKHYTVYNVEDHRWTYGTNVSQFDFWDSYLPQFEMAFVSPGKTDGAMCSYFAPNGVSMCGNPALLNGVLRSEKIDDYATGTVSKLPAGMGWNRSDAVVMSDCSAVFHMKQIMKLDDEGASAQAINAGLDVYGGWDDDLWTQGYLASAVAHNKTAEASIKRAVRRTMMQKMKVGIFDSPASDLPWAGLDAETLGHPDHVKINYDAAVQSFVLLKNGAGSIAKGAVADAALAQGVVLDLADATSAVLPLTASTASTIAVVGPMAMSTALISDYESGCIVGTDDTVASAITAANLGGQTTTAAGVDINSADTTKIAAALTLVKAAKITVLVLGITRVEEHEALDRHDTLLPGQQLPFAEQVIATAHAAGGKVILVVISGGILSLDAIAQDCDAIIDAFNPASQGPRALAALLFGHENRWGKLPVTIYPSNYTKDADAAGLTMQSMSFSDSPGRSYRYYTGEATFVFGAGLSYTPFKLTCTAVATATATLPITVKCSVTANGGAMRGDEVVQVYHRVGASLRTELEGARAHAVPQKRLVGFQRITLDGGASGSVSIEVAARQCSVTNEDGDYELHTGSHELVVETGVGGVAPIVLPFTVATAQKWINMHGF